MRLVGPFTATASAGGAGSTTSGSKLSGRIAGIYLEYDLAAGGSGSESASVSPTGSVSSSASASPSTVSSSIDILLKTVGSWPGIPSFKILEINDERTTGWRFPLRQSCDTYGAAIANEYSEVALYDFVTLEIQHATVGDSVSAWIMLRGERGDF